MLMYSKQGGARKLNHSLKGRRRKEARNRTLLRLDLPGGAWTGSSMAHKDKEPNALKNLARLTALVQTNGSISGKGSSARKPGRGLDAGKTPSNLQEVS